MVRRRHAATTHESDAAGNSRENVRSGSDDGRIHVELVRRTPVRVVAVKEKGASSPFGWRRRRQGAYETVPPLTLSTTPGTSLLKGNVMVRPVGSAR